MFNVNLSTQLKLGVFQLSANFPLKGVLIKENIDYK